MMKSLSQPIKLAKENLSQEPVTLIKIILPGLGDAKEITLRLATQNGIRIGSNSWLNLISDIGRIDAKPTATNGSISGDTHFRFSLINEKSEIFNPPDRLSSIFSRYSIEKSTVTVYQYFKGKELIESDLAKLFVGRITGPEKWDNQICEFDVISVGNIIGKQTIGRVINLTDYPDSPPESVGRFLPIPIGKVIVPGIPVYRFAETRLNGVLLPTDTRARVLSTDGFSSRGKFILGQYEITYTGKTANAFTGCSGIIEIHYNGDYVIEKLSNYPYVFFDKDYPVKSIKKIFNQSHLVPSSDYSIDQGNGLVTFNKKPHFLEASDSRFWYSHFDKADSTNKSKNPLNAIDSNDTTDAAEIDKSKRVFAVKQTDDLKNQGQIGRVFLQISHRANGSMPSDSLTVKIGNTTLRKLSKPGAGDSPGISGTPDFSLSVVDRISVAFNDANHNHALQSDPVIQQKASSGIGSSNIRLILTRFSLSIGFPSFTGRATKIEYSITVNMASSKPAIIIKINGKNAISFPSRSRGTRNGHATINHQANNITLTSSNGYNAIIQVLQASRTIHFARGTTSSRTNASVKKSGTVSVTKTPINMSKVTVSGSSNVVNDLIEITSHVGASWAWFRNKVLSIKYTGSSNNRTVYIIIARIVIEFVANKIIYSNKVSAQIEGVKDDGSGSATGSPGALIEKPHDAFKWSILKLLGENSSIINNPSFSSAGTAYSKAISGGYKFAGLIDSKQEIRKLWEKLARECRSIFYFDLGEARIFFRLSGFGDTVKNLDRTNIYHPERKSPITFKRTPLDQVANLIDLKFKRNWTELDDYQGIAHTQDNPSITQYGRRERPAQFDFNFVTDDVMANSLAEFYLSEYKQVWTWIEIQCFLDSVDLETYDNISINHDHVDPDGNIFHGQIMGASRQFGLGSKKRPDLIQLALKLSNDSIGTILNPDPLSVFCGISVSSIEVKDKPKPVNVNPPGATAFSSVNISGVSIVSLGHQITVHGNAQLDGRVEKFGTASLFLDGVGDYLSIPAHKNWQLGGDRSGDSFTVDFWYRPPNPVPSKGIFFSIKETDLSGGDGHETFFGYQHNARLVYGPVVLINNNSTPLLRIGHWKSPLFDKWNQYHIALVNDTASGKTFFFINGIKRREFARDSYKVKMEGRLAIGRGVTDPATSGRGFTGPFLKGFLDEFRISGVARWTEDFTPPTGPYNTDPDTRLLLHMDGTSGAATFIDSSK